MKGAASAGGPGGLDGSSLPHALDVLVGCVQWCSRAAVCSRAVCCLLPMVQLVLEAQRRRCVLVQCTARRGHGSACARGARPQRRRG